MPTQQHVPAGGVLIRRFTPEDFDVCRALWAELTQWHREIYNDPSIGGNDPGRHFEDHLRQVGPENIWIASMDREVIGLAGLIRGERHAEIEPVVVKEAFRGTRVGRLLVETIIKAARADKIRQLTVRPVARNERAIAFFHKLGFDTLGQIELIMDLGGDGKSWKAGPKVFKIDFRF